MKRKVSRVSPATGHNSDGDLASLAKRARDRQIAAQGAWLDLMQAQIAHHQPWAEILSSAAKTGVGLDVVRTKFNVSPSTFSRWMSGFASPSIALRTRLSADLVELAKTTNGSLPAGSR